MDNSFTDRWKCFYCDNGFSHSEVAAGRICCSPCHDQRLHGSKRYPRVYVTHRVVPIDMDKRAYISIPHVSLDVLARVRVPGDPANVENVYAHVHSAKKGIATVFVTMADPEWVAARKAAQAEAKRLAEEEARKAAACHE